MCGPLRLMVLAGALFIAMAAPVAAHSTGLGAFVTLDPPRAQAGEAIALRVEVVDAYNNPVGGAEVTAAPRQEGGWPGEAAVMAEAGPGTYTGEVTFADPGPWQIQIEARAGGWLYVGTVPVTVGSGAEPVQDLGIILDPVEEGLGHTNRTWLIAAGAVGLLTTAAAALAWGRHRSFAERIKWENRDRRR